ncbi:hypothetical protein [Candidatus Pollutiaquabacter sp.]|uniref:hypothetical protein n=1 Tax=Candidatus Pollutiaquabacter sp. TaxID=3416354 RepID=UPI003C9F606E|nr:hypothetical protein [Bacteroidota bacterium]
MEPIEYINDWIIENVDKTQLEEVAYFFDEGSYVHFLIVKPSFQILDETTRDILNDLVIKFESDFDNHSICVIDKNSPVFSTNSRKLWKSHSSEIQLYWGNYFPILIPGDKDWIPYDNPSWYHLPGYEFAFPKKTDNQIQFKVLECSNFLLSHTMGSLSFNEFTFNWLNIGMKSNVDIGSVEDITDENYALAA